ncbi:MAG: DUF6472 family protein [Lachnospiraceae bacterium]|nr:DUF6472 family protein [Lachnospiraceae bacterium]
MAQCDDCQFLAYDEEYDEYYCSVDMDEDEYAKFMESEAKPECPYYKNGNEYLITRKQ